MDLLITHQCSRVFLWITVRTQCLLCCLCGFLTAVAHMQAATVLYQSEGSAKLIIPKSANFSIFLDSLLEQLWDAEQILEQIKQVVSAVLIIYAMQVYCYSLPVMIT